MSGSETVIQKIQSSRKSLMNCPCRAQMTNYEFLEQSTGNVVQ